MTVMDKVRSARQRRIQKKSEEDLNFRRGRRAVFNENLGWEVLEDVEQVRNERNDVRVGLTEFAMWEHRHMDKHDATFEIEKTIDTGEDLLKPSKAPEEVCAKYSHLLDKYPALPQHDLRKWEVFLLGYRRTHYGSSEFNKKQYQGS